MTRSATRDVLLCCLSLTLLACSNRTSTQASVEATSKALNAAPRLPDFVVLVANSAKVWDRAALAGGDLGVANTGGGPFLANGFQLALINAAHVEASRNVIAYAIDVVKDASARGVQTNRLTKGGGPLAASSDHLRFTNHVSVPLLARQRSWTFGTPGGGRRI